MSTPMEDEDQFWRQTTSVFPDYPTVETNRQYRDELRRRYEKEKFQAAEEEWARVETAAGLRMKDVIARTAEMIVNDPELQEAAAQDDFPLTDLVSQFRNAGELASNLDTYGEWPRRVSDLRLTISKYRAFTVFDAADRDLRAALQDYKESVLGPAAPETVSPTEEDEDEELPAMETLSKWKGVEVTLLTSDTIRIASRGIVSVVTSEMLGLVDGRTSDQVPSQAWKTACDPLRQVPVPDNKNTRRDLRKFAKAISSKIGAPPEPFILKNGYWVPAFKVVVAPPAPAH